MHLMKTMGLKEEVVHSRVASVTGVPMAEPQPSITPPIIEASKQPVKIPVTPPKQKLPKPTLKRVRITKERGNLTRSGYIYKAMTNLGATVTQLKYDIMLRSLKGVDKPQKVANTQTTPEGGISCTVPELVRITTKSEISESKDSLPPYPVTGSKVYIKWDEQQIGEYTYAKGRSSGVILRPSISPKLRPKKVPTTVPASKQPVKIPVIPPVTPPVVITRKKPSAIARGIKRKVSARAEELMEKKGFPKAVKEAIEKGLERKEAPRDIERIIEKVSKTNAPDYTLHKTIAKRMSKRGIVQYKVDTDKGTIIYENADEKDVNAILGMPTPTGEIIPLQIKVIK